DERTVQLNNKIQSEGFALVIGLLSISIFIKTYILDMSASGYIAELVVMAIAVLYITIRSSILGFNSFDYPINMKKLIIPSSIALGLLITVVSGIRNFSLYGDKYTGITDGHFLAALGFTFVSSTIFIGVIIGVLYSVGEFGQKRLEKKLQDEDK
ncbi:DUF6773 family protein, partial [Enterococcus pallens]